MKHHDSFERDAPRTCTRRQYRSIPLLVSLLMLSFRTTCSAQALIADSTLANQILDCSNQLRAIVPVAEQFKDQREQVLSALAELEATARDGQSYLALYRLQSLWTSIQPAEYSRSRDDVAKQGLPAFEQSWRRLAT